MEFDVVIAGAGLVGSTLALGLSEMGISTALVDPKPWSSTPSQSWDARVFAISPGSEQLLHQLDVWRHLDAARLAPVYKMIVRGDRAEGAITFDAMAAGVSHLATIVENTRLQAALEEEIARRDSIRVFAPVRISAIDWGRERVEVALSEAPPIQAKLLVGADGADSFVRTQACIDSHYRAYGQGVVANFEAEKPHRGRAFQWFRQDGVLALLPLADRLVSMVWSTSNDQANRLMTSSVQELAGQVQEACYGVLGALSVVTPPRAFPLRYQRAEKIIGPRLALVGDAAHNVHPLAGQGVNLGFRDVAVLIRLLRERSAGVEVGDNEVLTKYQRERAEDILSVVTLTDGLQKLFKTTNPLVRALRNRGMSMIDRISPAKSALIQRALL